MQHTYSAINSSPESDGTPNKKRKLSDASDNSIKSNSSVTLMDDVLNPLQRQHSDTTNSTILSDG